MKIYVVILLKREDKGLVISASLAGEFQRFHSHLHLEPPPTSTSPGFLKETPI